MTDDLRTALLAIDGVGEATADKIEAAIAEHGTDADSDDLREALAHCEAGNAGYAAKYVRRALDAVEG